MAGQIFLIAFCAVGIAFMLFVLVKLHRELRKDKGESSGLLVCTSREPETSRRTSPYLRSEARSDSGSGFFETRDSYLSTGPILIRR